MAIGVINSTSIPDVVTRHHHFNSIRQLHRAGHVRRTEVKLRTVVSEERRMTATFFLAQDVDFRLELLVRSDACPVSQQPDRVPRLPS